MARRTKSVKEFEKNTKKEYEFNCCKTKESAVKFCIKCKKIFHNSCLVGYKKIKVFSSTEIQCCDIITPEEKKYNDLMITLKNLQAYCAGIEKEMKAIKTENKRLQSQKQTGEISEISMDSENVSLLKRLVEEIADKNQLLVEKNNYLQQKLGSFVSKDSHKYSYAQVVSSEPRSATPLIVNIKDKNNIETTNRIKNIIIEKKSAVELF